MPARNGAARRPMARPQRVALTGAAAMLMAAGVQAQSSACDDFKAVLAARIESTGVRGYSLEAVRAGTPLPPGARVIGNCDAGAYNIVYRRWGAARAASASASAAASAVSAVPSAARPAEAAAAVQGPAIAALPAPTAATADASAVRKVDRDIERTAEREAATAAAQLATRAVAVPAAPPAAAAPSALGSLAQRAVDLGAAHWPWGAALLLLPLAIWVWRRYFSAYDKDGLPRGPRL